MTDGDLLADVRTWLDKSGLPFEMKAAASLRKVATVVSQGERFRDPSTHIDREVDVCGYFVGPPNHLVKVVVECKADTAPWVLFMGYGGTLAVSPVVLGDRGCTSCVMLEDAVKGLLRPLPRAYSITQKRTDRKMPDFAYEATQQAASAVLGSLAKDGGWTGHGSGSEMPVFFLPVVATRAPLVACWLDEQGEVQVGPVGMARLSVQRMDIQGQADCIEVVVVNADYFAEFVGRIAEGIPGTMAALFPNPPGPDGSHDETYPPEVPRP